MASYALNQELNGIEISFNSKPGADTLEALKAAGYRWHRAKKVWYAKQTAERLTLAKSIAELADTKPVDIEPVRIDRQKELKAVYMELIKKCWESPEMIGYFDKECGYVVALDDGDLTVIDKPRIETSFCFGHGYCGVTTEEDENRANNMAHVAATDQNYFIRENLKDIDRYISLLKGEGDYKVVFHKHLKYSGQESGDKLKGVGYDRWSMVCDDMPTGEWHGMKDCAVLSDNEIQALIEGYEEVRKAFEKRLKTYLKRYGLSKVRTWSYLSD